MILTLEILAGWVAIAFIWGHVLVVRGRHDYRRQPTEQERDIITEAGREWMKTGQIDERYIQQLEALGNNAPGTWRKIARQR